MKTDKVLLGVLGGLATGALLGILYAPDKGINTRKRIKRKSNEYADDLKDLYDTSIESVSKKFDSLKKESQHLFDEGVSKFNIAQKELENLK